MPQIHQNSQKPEKSRLSHFARRAAFYLGCATHLVAPRLFDTVLKSLMPNATAERDFRCGRRVIIRNASCEAAKATSHNQLMSDLIQSDRESLSRLFANITNAAQKRIQRGHISLHARAAVAAARRGFSGEAFLPPA